MIIREHLSFKSDLTLMEFTEHFMKLVEINEFKTDYENENNWSWAYDEDHIEINISKPFEEGTLQEWDDTVPQGCNFGVSLLSSDNNFNYKVHKYNHFFVLERLIPKYTYVIQQITNTKVYYNRGNHLKGN
jgi:hypothetical protein